MAKPVKIDARIDYVDWLAVREKREMYDPYRWLERFGWDTILAVDLRHILRKHGVHRCPNCRRHIGWGDVAWNNGNTEYGTPHSTVDIICEGCQTEIVKVNSWWPSIDDKWDVLGVLYRDWKDDEDDG